MVKIDNTYNKDIIINEVINNKLEREYFIKGFLFGKFKINPLKISILLFFKYHGFSYPRQLSHALNKDVRLVLDALRQLQADMIIEEPEIKTKEIEKFERAYSQIKIRGSRPSSFYILNSRFEDEYSRFLHSMANELIEQDDVTKIKYYESNVSQRMRQLKEENRSTDEQRLNDLLRQRNVVLKLINDKGMQFEGGYDPRRELETIDKKIGDTKKIIGNDNT